MVPDSKVHGANMGPNWGRQDPGGPFVGPRNFAICSVLLIAFLDNLSRQVHPISWFEQFEVNEMKNKQQETGIVFGSTNLLGIKVCGSRCRI